jgi:hypothetical protein
MKRRTLALVAVMTLCAGYRLLATSGPAIVEVIAPVELPPETLGFKARSLPLSKAEEKLAQPTHVEILHRRYGTTDVSLVSVAGGLREIHPPSVCLKATGFEIVAQRQITDGPRCVVELKLRSGKGRNRIFHTFVYTYTDGETVTCSFWRRIGSSAVARLTGKSKTWSTVQVMDRNAADAHALMMQLLNTVSKKRKRYAIAN